MIVVRTEVRWILYYLGTRGCQKTKKKSTKVRSSAENIGALGLSITGSCQE